MGSGYSGLYSGTYGSRNMAYYMSPTDPFSRFIKNRKDIDANGFYDVIAHGTPNNIVIEQNGIRYTVNHRIAASVVKNHPGYKGEPIRLLSCDTGALSQGFAQNLANKLNVVVMAPTKIVWAWPNGRYLVAGKNENGTVNMSDRGKFVKFYPGGKKK